MRFQSLYSAMALIGLVLSAPSWARHGHSLTGAGQGSVRSDVVSVRGFGGARYCAPTAATTNNSPYTTIVNPYSTGTGTSAYNTAVNPYASGGYPGTSYSFGAYPLTPQYPQQSYPYAYPSGSYTGAYTYAGGYAYPSLNSNPYGSGYPSVMPTSYPYNYNYNYQYRLAGNGSSYFNWQTNQGGFTYYRSAAYGPY